MAFNYTYPPDTDLLWVRFLCGDTDEDSYFLEDEEILAILDEETATGKALKYYAAATALDLMRTKWASAGAGLVSKTVGRLTKIWGLSGTSEDIVRSRINWLRTRGSQLSATAPWAFRVL